MATRSWTKKYQTLRSQIKQKKEVYIYDESNPAATQANPNPNPALAINVNSVSEIPAWVSVVDQVQSDIKKMKTWCK